MQVLLKEVVEKLGNVGDVVEVAPGYARNFLFPKGKAVPLTPANLVLLEQEKSKKVKAQEEKRLLLAELAEKINHTSCTILASANEEGELYGSVTPREVLLALKEQKIEVEEKAVTLQEPIKELGVYVVPINLAEDIQAELKVWVVGE
ncbi:MAG: hypothetical protein AMS15_07980 [Planctomycetes bacterium DG_23]|nr:MAG: hypothetical protein AMS15_07980 [Planctomycetes bacterium DG_23]